MAVRITLRRRRLGEATVSVHVLLGGLTICRCCRCCVHSLGSILKERTLSAGKLDEIKIKANILDAFRPAKIEEKVEIETGATEEVHRDEL